MSKHTRVGSLCGRQWGEHLLGEQQPGIRGWGWIEIVAPKSRYDTRILSKEWRERGNLSLCAEMSTFHRHWGYNLTYLQGRYNSIHNNPHVQWFITHKSILSRIPEAEIFSFPTSYNCLCLNLTSLLTTTSLLVNSRKAQPVCWTLSRAGVSTMGLGPNLASHLFGWNQPCPFFTSYCPDCFGATETELSCCNKDLWPVKPKIFTIQPFAEKVYQSQL